MEEAAKFFKGLPGIETSYKAIPQNMNTAGGAADCSEDCADCCDCGDCSCDCGKS